MPRAKPACSGLQWTACWVFVLGLVEANCGGSSIHDGGRENDSGPDGAWSVDLGATADAGVAIDWATACKAYASAQCSTLSSCAPVGFGVYFGNAEKCEARYGGTNCERQMASTGSTATAADLVACASAMKAQTCAARSGSLPTECLWRGLFPESAPCVYDQQCQSSRCARRSDNWCGTCQPRVPTGAVCSATERDCESGLVCAEGGCSVATQDGGTCKGTTSWTCTVPLGVGASCASGTQCEWGLVCIGSRCVPWKVRGEDCSSTPDCGRDTGTYCLATSDGTHQVCTLLSFAEAGDRCDLGSHLLCSASTKCVGTDGQSSIAGVCLAPIADGNSCGGVANCLYPARCVSGRCVTAAEALTECR
jgi:hypothetical protein